jgi:N-acetylneuraminic acid mutarotase
MSVSRSEMPAAVLNGLIYVPGGFGNAFIEAAGFAFEAYDPASDAWQTLAPMPYAMNHHAIAAYDNALYVFDADAPVLRYDPAANAWTELGPMPERRWAAAAVALDDYVYIVGGTGGTGALLRYEPANDAWATLAAPLQRREHLQAVILDSKIYALGGRWDSGLSSVDIYDPATDTWRRGLSMRQRRSGFGAAVLDGRIVVAGGELLSPLDIMDSVEFFDPAVGQWQVAPFTLPVPLHGFPMVAIDNSLYVIGGSGRAGEISNRGTLFVWRP